MSIVKRQNFHLKKIKVLKDKFSVSATLDYAQGDLISQRKWGIESNSERPHEDLHNILLSWTPLLAKTWNLNKEQINDVTCTGLSIEKKSEGEHITLTGNYRTAGGYVRGFSSPPIVLKDEFYGFEETLTKDVENMKDEAYAFYADDKQASMQLTTEELQQEAGE